MLDVTTVTTENVCVCVCGGGRSSDKKVLNHLLSQQLTNALHEECQNT